MENKFKQMYCRLSAAVLDEVERLVEAQTAAGAIPESLINQEQIKISLLEAQLQVVRTNLRMALARTEGDGRL